MLENLRQNIGRHIHGLWRKLSVGIGRHGINHAAIELIEAEWRIYASMNWVIIGFENGLSPNRRQAIFETNADLSLNEHRGTNLIEIWISF